MVKLAEHMPEPGLVGMVLRDAFLGQQIEDAKFFLPEPFVGDKIAPLDRQAGLAHDQLGGFARPIIWRDQHHLRPLRRRERAEPSAERLRLFASETAERHVRVAQIEVQGRQACLLRLLAREIADALPVADHPQPIRPALLHFARPSSRSLLGTRGFRTGCLDRAQKAKTSLLYG